MAGEASVKSRHPSKHKTTLSKQAADRRARGNTEGERMALVSSPRLCAVVPHVTPGANALARSSRRSLNARERRGALKIITSAASGKNENGSGGVGMSGAVRGKAAQAVVALAGSALLCSSSVPSAAASLPPVPDRSIPFSEVASHDGGTNPLQTALRY